VPLFTQIYINRYWLGNRGWGCSEFSSHRLKGIESRLFEAWKPVSGARVTRRTKIAEISVSGKWYRYFNFYYFWYFVVNWVIKVFWSQTSSW